MKDRGLRESADNNWRRHLLAALALMWSCLSTTSAAHAQSLSPQEPALSWPLELRKKMLRLNDVEWRLRVAVGPNCPSPSPATGMTIDHIAAYDQNDHAILQRSLGMTSRPQVAAVAMGSPAALAGVRPGDEILSIEGAPSEVIFNRELLAEGLTDWLATRPVGNPVIMELRRGSLTLRKVITPIVLCAGRAILKTDGRPDAYSDQHDLAISTGMIAFTANDDELSLIIGHELAHVILAEDDRAENPRKREVEADILGAHLAHCAGYNVANAAMFWQRYGARSSAKWPHRADHAPPQQRQRSIEQAARSFTCPVRLPAMASSGPK